MLGAFERLGQSVLRRLGQDAFLLRGAVSTPTRANVEFDVAVSTPDGYNEGAFMRDVVTLPSNTQPKIGDVVQIGADSYILDGLLANNGALVRYTVQKS